MQTSISSAPRAVDPILIVAMFLLPSTMGLIGGAASGIFILVFLLSLPNVLLNAPVQISRLARPHIVQVFLLLAIVGIAGLGLINTTDTQQYWSRFERLARALGCILIFLYFVGYKVSLTRAFELGLLPASAFVFIVSLQQSRSFGWAEGAYNTILFGDFSAYLACAAAAGMLSYRGRPAMVLAFFLGAVMSVNASILSGTRGAWVAMYLGLSLVLVVWLLSIRHKVGLAGAVALGASILTSATWLLTLHPIVSSRTNDAIATFMQFFSGGDPNTSVGQRLQMWQAATKIWATNPLLGSGLGDYSIDLASLMKTGASSMTAHFGEAHSLYFEFLSTTGLLGLAMIVLGLFVMPAYIFARSGVFSEKHQSPTFSARLHGLILIVVFFSFGLTQNWLGRSSISSVFFLCLAVFWADVVVKGKPGGEPGPGA